MAKLDCLKILKQGVGAWNQWREENDEKMPDLRKADLSNRPLQKVNFHGANLQHADLAGADLRNASLSNADLASATLTRANLQQANLSWANLSSANLINANLQQAILFEANLDFAILIDANLQEANFTEASMRETHFARADLRGANHKEAWHLMVQSDGTKSGKNCLVKMDFRYVNLSEADLSEMNLSNTNFSGANLSKANLSRADFSCANLSCADLRGANLSEAILCGTNLSEVNLRHANLSKVMCESFIKKVWLLIKSFGYRKKEETMEEINSNKTKSTSDQDLNEDVKQKFKSALDLVDYAICENLDVSDEIISKLYKSKKENDINESELDIAIRDLTSITYPTTIKTIRTTKTLQPTKFLWLLVIISLLALATAIAGYAKMEFSTELWQSLINVSLGMLGAQVYVYFNLIGIMKAQAFEPDAIFENSLRIVLGGILGWLFFYTFKTQIADQKNFLFILLPFLAGFSTRLVFGVLNQAITAIQITLGIEDKRSKILRRPKGDK